MKKIAILSLLFFSVLAMPLYAQKSLSPNVKALSKDERKKLEFADMLYKTEKYLDALPVYNELLQSHYDDNYLKFRTGMCHLYDSNDKEKSIIFLEEVKKSNPELVDIDFNLGRAYHLNYRFDEAIAVFNKYLTTSPSINQQLLTKRYIDNCLNGKVYTELKTKYDIENVGKIINTENREYVPVISADESVLIYTYLGTQSSGGLQDDDGNPDITGHYFEDVFISQRLGEQWLTPESIGTNINTDNHDACIALSADGQKLFLFHSTPEDGGDIYISKLDGEIWGKPQRLGPNINTKYWEGSCSLSADEKTLYFSSERAGGMGGKDIYVSQKMADGTWGTAQNLGAPINTKLNDDSPFIHSDGITLFYSSEGHKSIGGYDIMYSTLKDGTWTEPTNLGAPINTPEDERFYVLTADGEHGYFSSDRKGGFGQQDIYSVSNGFYGEKPLLALVLGNLMADDKPIEGVISVTNKETGDSMGVYHSNSVTGKYVVPLKPGNTYKLAIDVKGYEQQIQYLDVKGLQNYVKVQKNFKFYSEGYIKENNILIIKDSSDLMQKLVNQQVKQYNDEKNPDVYEARVYKELLKKYGDVKKDSTTYRVELGTYANAKDFNADMYKDLGIIESSMDTKGNTTYSIGSFNTLLEAEIFKYKVIQKDTASKKNISVAVVEKGKSELLQQHFQNEYTRADYVVPVQPKVITEPIVAQNTATAIVEKKAEPVKEIVKETPKIEETKTVAKVEEVKKEEIKTTETTANPCDPSASTDFAYFVGKDLNNKEDYNKLIAQAGGICVDGLTFRVQIGAYRKPQNFKHKNLSSLEPPPAVSVAYPDGITRFTMRDFKTLKEAEKFRQECIRLGTKDAWVTSMYQEKRMLLQELIANNFFNKPVN